MKILNFIFIALSLILFGSSCNGCQKIPANQIVLNSDNYGKDWRQLSSSETVPVCGMPGCYNVFLPATTMVGDLSSIQRVGKTGESARVKFLYTYQWEIQDPLAFIREAKELKNGDYTTDGSLEGIENRLVDKHFHDVSAVLLVDESVRNFDQASFEKKLIQAINDDLKKYGILITAASVVPEFGRFLEDALDAASALDFYKSIGEESLGREIIKQNAGATKVVVTNNSIPKEEDKD